MTGNNEHLRHYMSVLLGALITSVAVTPILLLHTLITGRDGETTLLICVITWVIGGTLSWREGAPLGAGRAIVIAVATVAIPTDSSVSGFANFLLVFAATTAASLLRAGRVTKFVVVLLLSGAAVALNQSWKPVLVVCMAASVTAVLIALIAVVGSETKQIFASLKGKWGLVIAYLALSAGAVFVFALWYQLAFFYWPDTAFEGIQAKEPLDHAGVVRTFPIFLYQSMLVFADGPPYRPTLGVTRLLVGLEAACSMLLIGLYLSLIANNLSQSKEMKR